MPDVISVCTYNLRFFGQGAMSHAGETSMARYFENNRGKALSVSTLGGMIGVMILPMFIIYLMKQSKLPYILQKIVSNLDIQLYLKQTTSPFYILDLTHSSWQVSLFNFLYKVLPK